MIVIGSMRGLGDNIYQRAFVGKLGPCWLDTPWPELYGDMPQVKFYEPKTTLRTQRRNIALQAPGIYGRQPKVGVRRIAYGHAGIIAGMRATFGVQPGRLTLPSFGDSPLAGTKYALVRPATLRAEWPAESRNPDPRYIAEACELLRAAGIKVISVADLEDGAEWLVGEAPPADVRMHRGELGISDLMRLVEHAHLVVGGIGWLVPAAIAYGTPAWIICGGQGGYNHPDKITDSACMNLDNIQFITPDRHCMCTQRDHHCDKTISGHRGLFAAYLATRA